MNKLGRPGEQEGLAAPMTLNEGTNATAREREETATSFDEANDQALSTTLGDIELLRATLTFATLKSEPPDFDPWFHAVALLNRARETLLSSVYLARHRVPGDAFALLRVAVETAAVAVHITQDPVAFNSYVGLSGKKYAASNAIAAVRSLIPQLPEVWGSLSDAAIHTNVHAFGPTRDAGGDRVIHLFRQKTDPWQDRQSLRCVSLAAALVFRAAELALFDAHANEPGWLELPGGSMRATATAERLVERRYQEFTSGAQEPAQQCDAAARPSAGR